MLDPRSHRFLDAKFKRARFYWWQYVTQRHWRRLHGTASFATHMRRVRKTRQVFDCRPHENRRPNPAATAIPDRYDAEVCLDCGVGIVSHRARG
jgi:hypothetical protein